MLTHLCMICVEDPECLCLMYICIIYIMLVHLIHVIDWSSKGFFASKIFMYVWCIYICTTGSLTNIAARNSCGRLNSSIHITTTTIPNFIKLLSTSTMILPTTSTTMQQSSTCSPIQLIKEQSGNVCCM